METPTNSFHDDAEIQHLIKQQQDTKSELQFIKDEVDRINNDVKKCREEMDRRMMVMVQMDEGMWNSLLELDTIMQEKKTLADQLELSLSSTVESKQALLRSLLEEEKSLQEQERNLKLKCEHLRKELTGVSSNTEEVSQNENPVKPSSSSRRKPTDKPVRKRGARK